MSPRFRSRSSLATRRPVSPLALVAFYLVNLLGLAAMLAGFGSRFGWWPFRTGFTILEWVAYGGIAVALLALVAVFTARPGGPRSGLVLAVLALIGGIAIAGVPWQWRQTARSVPPIHDISTDTDNPPRFVAVLPLRADAPNPAEYGGPEIAAQQGEAYADIQPVVLAMPPAQAFARVREAAGEMGWEIIEADSVGGRLEATDQTFWFGFKDDVVVRVAPQGSGSRVDVRSVSRVGGSDVGTNARRVRDFTEALREGE